MSEQNTRIQEALSTLRYSPKWIECGALAEDFFCKQLEEFSQSDDKHTEHYRYAAFRAILSQEGRMSGELIESFIELAQLDEDQGMARAALQGLIRSPRLTTEQFKRLGRHVSLADEPLRKVYERQELMRELKATATVNDDLFEKVLSRRRYRSAASTFRERESIKGAASGNQREWSEPSNKEHSKAGATATTLIAA